MADLHTKAIFDLWDFIDLIDFRGGRTAFDPEFHVELVDFLAKAQHSNEEFDKRRLILVARGHLKSTLCTVAYTLWRVYRNPDIRIIISTVTKELASQLISEIRQYLEDEFLQDKVWNNRPHIPGRLIPVLESGHRTRRHRKWEDQDNESEDKKVIWRANALQVVRRVKMKDPTVIVATPGMNVSGLHYDLSIKDDIINDVSVETPQKIAKTLRYAHNVDSVLDPPRKVLLGEINGKKYYEYVGNEDIILGTLYAHGDYYHHIRDNLELFEYKVLEKTVYKNGVNNTAGYNFPAKFNDRYVEQLKKRLGPSRFASQYMNVILAEEEKVLLKENIQWLHPSSYDIAASPGLVEVTHKDAPYPVNVRPHIVLDPAISQKKTADFSVLLVGGKDSEGNLYVFDFKFGRWKPHEMVEKLYELMDKWQLYSLWVETVGYQLAIIPTIKTYFHAYRPIVLKEYLPRGDKLARIKTNLEPVFHNRMVYMSQWMSTCSELMAEIEFLGATNMHDDIVDAMSMLVECSKKTGDRRKNKVVPLPMPVNTRWGGIR